jgi:hypothetical protein
MGGIGAGKKEARKMKRWGKNKIEGWGDLSILDLGLWIAGA